MPVGRTELEPHLDAAILAGRPFMPNRRRTHLIVDEAQKLAGRVLETIRGLRDRGDEARLGNESAFAFGCVLVGNPTLMSKGGAQHTASFEPLVSRLTCRQARPCRPTTAASTGPASRAGLM